MDPGYGVKANGNGLGFLVLPRRHVQVPWTSHTPFHLSSLWSGSRLWYLFSSGTFPLGPVVKGLVPRSGIQTAQSASEEGPTDNVAAALATTPGLFRSQLSLGAELSQLSLPNCLSTVKVGKWLLSLTDLGKMELFCLDLESRFGT